MKVDSLDELESAFAEWRRGKKHPREAMPEELRARALRATKKHGVPAVVRVTRVERARLFRSKPARKKVQGATRKATRVRRGRSQHSHGLSWARPRQQARAPSQRSRRGPA